MCELFGTDRVFGGASGRIASADEGGMRDRGDRPDLHLYRAAALNPAVIREAVMKVIVLDRPKILGFFLRRIYGIKKVKDVNQ